MHICHRKCSINAKFYAKEITEDNVLVEFICNIIIIIFSKFKGLFQISDDKCRLL